MYILIFHLNLIASSYLWTVSYITRIILYRILHFVDEEWRKLGKNKRKWRICNEDWCNGAKVWALSMPISVFPGLPCSVPEWRSFLLLALHSLNWDKVLVRSVDNFMLCTGEGFCFRAIPVFHLFSLFNLLQLGHH